MTAEERWEYQWIHGATEWSEFGPDPAFVARLNAMGEDGWEVVEAVQSPGGGRWGALLKRPRPSPDEPSGG